MDKKKHFILNPDGSKKPATQASIFELYYEDVYEYNDKNKTNKPESPSPPTYNNDNDSSKKVQTEKKEEKQHQNKNDNVSTTQDLIGYIIDSPTANKLAVIINYDQNNNQYKIIDYDENEKIITSNIAYPINPAVNCDNINTILSWIQKLNPKQISTVIYGIETRKNKIINNLKSQLQHKIK